MARTPDGRVSKTKPIHHKKCFPSTVVTRVVVRVGVKNGNVSVTFQTKVKIF